MALSATGTSDFSQVDEGQLLITILALADGVQAGEKVAVMTFADASTFALEKFTFTSGVDGFSGTLYQQISGDTLTLGVQITAVPEPSTAAVILAGSMALVAVRRARLKSRKRLS